MMRRQLIRTFFYSHTYLFSVAELVSKSGFICYQTRIVYEQLSLLVPFYGNRGL